MSSMYGTTGSNLMNPALKSSVPKGYSGGTMQNFTPEQLNLFKSLFSQVSPDSFLSRLSGGDQSQFQQLEEPALRQFGELQSGIASRFAGLGSGALRSSGHFNAQNTAAKEFASDLQSKRMNIQRQALMDLMGLSESLLQQRPYEQFILPNAPKKPSFLQSLFGGILPGISHGFGNQLGAKSWF